MYLLSDQNLFDSKVFGFATSEIGFVHFEAKSLALTKKN